MWKIAKNYTYVYIERILPNKLEPRIERTSITGTELKATLSRIREGASDPSTIFVVPRAEVRIRKSTVANYLRYSDRMFNSNKIDCRQIV